MTDAAPLSPPDAPIRAIAKPSKGLRGCLRPPGDKSISHRALMFGARAAGETTIEGLLEGADVLATAAAVEALGANTRQDAPGRWRVRGVGEAGFASPDQPLDLGNAGTGCRLLMGLVAGAGARATFVGDESLTARPMGRILEPLLAMGARVESRDGRLPAMVDGAGGLNALTWDSPKASAQIKSAVLLAGLGAPGETLLREPALSREHTEEMLRAFGVAVASSQQGDGAWTHRLKGPADLTAPDAPVKVPGDPSSAMFSIVAALIAGGSSVDVEGVLLSPTRTGGLAMLEAMGADLSTSPDGGDGPPIGTVRVKAGALTGGLGGPDTASYIDEVPVLAVAAAFAEGDTRFENVAELRVKESDRIAATCALLNANGVQTEDWPDGFLVRGRGPDGVPGGGLVETRHDHRIAMAALILGLGAQEPVTIDDAAMIATSYPSFFTDMRALGADVAVLARG